MSVRDDIIGQIVQQMSSQQNLNQASGGFDDPLMEQTLRNYIESIYGGRSAQTNDIVAGILGGGNPATMPNSGYLTDTLKSLIGGANPAIAKMRQAGNMNIENNLNKNLTTTKERLASSGLGRSGVGVSALNEAYAGAGAAKANLEGSLAGQEQQWKSQAINQLLGLSGAEAGNKLSYLNMFMGNKANADQMNYQRENTASPWMSILGSLIGAGAQIGSAGLLAGGGGAAAASDKSLKKNIKTVGKTKEGIPLVTFDYKDGGKAKYLGMLSKDVKKKHPEAVKEVVDYSKVPGSVMLSLQGA